MWIEARESSHLSRASLLAGQRTELLFTIGIIKSNQARIIRVARTSVNTRFSARIAHDTRCRYTHPPIMIRFRLDELLKSRDWSDYRLAQESGIGANVIGKYRRNLVRRPDLEIVSRMCAALRCSVGELMQYIPDKTSGKSRKQ